MNVKIKRTEKDIEKKIANIIASEVKDLRKEMITVNEVQVTRDLSIAKIYFTCLNKEAKEEILKKLIHAKGFIRSELAKQIEIRHIPELEFIYDDSIEYGSNIEKIINNLHKKPE